jgi:hypothetical protein
LEAAAHACAAASASLLATMAPTTYYSTINSCSSAFVCGHVCLHHVVSCGGQLPHVGGGGAWPRCSGVGGAGWPSLELLARLAQRAWRASAEDRCTYATASSRASSTCFPRCATTTSCGSSGGWVRAATGERGVVRSVGATRRCGDRQTRKQGWPTGGKT